LGASIAVMLALEAPFLARHRRFADYPQLEHGTPRMEAHPPQRRLLSMHRIVEQAASPSRS
jgi:hypothetical protein